MGCLKYLIVQREWEVGCVARDVALVEQGNHRFGVDNLSAGRVHHVGPTREHSQSFLVQHSLSLFIERKMDGENIRNTDRLTGPTSVSTFVMHDIHVESISHRMNFHTYATRAQNTKCLALQLHPLEGVTVPVALAHVIEGPGNMAHQRQDERPGMLSRRGNGAQELGLALKAQDGDTALLASL